MLDAKQRRAVELLAAGSMQKEAAAQVGVRAEQVSRWCADPEFAAELEAAVTAVAAETRTILRGATARAAAFLLEAVEDTGAPYPSRISAARDLLDRAGFKPRDEAQGSEPSAEDQALAREFIAWREQQKKTEAK